MARRKKSRQKSRRWIWFLISRPVLWIPLLIGLGGWYAFEVHIARPALSYMGEPKISDPYSPWLWNRTLRNEGFLVGYSDLRGNPLWVMYRLEKLPKESRRHKRPGRFEQDWRNLTAIDHHSYTHSGFDRGHMAPNYAISRLYGREAQLDTFKMTNITPQKPWLNQNLWRELEEREIHRFAERFETLWVVTGPVFDKNRQRLESDIRVEIPDAFYKVYLGIRAGREPQALALVIPQDVFPSVPLKDYIVAVDDVEIMTGLDFFPLMEPTLQQRVEARLARDIW